MAIDPVFQNPQPIFKLQAWPTDLYFVSQVYCNFDEELYPEPPHLHCGIDISCLDGRPYYAAADGDIEHIGFDSAGYGHFILLNHEFGSDVFQTLYAHNFTNQSVPEFPKTSGSVKAGEIIGFCGDSGHSDGGHCHFELRLANHQSSCDCSPGRMDPWPKLEPLFNRPVIRGEQVLTGWIEDSPSIIEERENGSFVNMGVDTPVFRGSTDNTVIRTLFVGEAAKRGFKMVRRDGRIRLRVAQSL